MLSKATNTVATILLSSETVLASDCILFLKNFVLFPFATLLPPHIIYFNAHFKLKEQCQTLVDNCWLVATQPSILEMHAMPTTMACSRKPSSISMVMA